jgi:hypothetical protein
MRSRRPDTVPPHPARRDGRSGAIRPAGLAAAIVTAGAVFGLGVLVLPSISPEAPPVPVVEPPPPPPPPPPPSPPPVDAAMPRDAAVADAATAEVSPKAAPIPASKPVAADEPPAPPVAVEASKPAAEVAAPAKGETSATHEKSTDKDVARDAWRKNLPDISPEPGKSSILIPIKGSIDGSTYHVTARPKSVLVSLPKGESMITMPFYNIRHDGFRQLWIKKDDQTGLTTIRVVLGEATDPQVEIKDEFVRVTVRRPDETPAAAPSPAATPASAPEPVAHDPVPPTSPTSPTPTPPPAPAAHEPPAPAHD